LGCETSLGIQRSTIVERWSLKVTTDVYMQAVSLQKREAQSKLMRMVLKTSASN